MKHFAAAALALTVFASFAAEKVVFKETFDSPDALKKWKIETPADGSKYRVENGALVVEHKHKPGFRSYIEIPIPLLKKGKLEFDVLIDPDRQNPKDRIGLTLDIYNISTFWHDSCKDWRAYFPEPETERLRFFDIEPVGHQRISIVPKYKYVHYCINFDHKADMVEFYAQDMSDPKSSRYDISVWGHDYYQGAYLKIGSYAYASDTYKTLVDNVVLTEITDDGNEVAGKKEEILVFNGLGTVHFFMNDLLKGEKFRMYSWESPGHNATNNNNFQYTKTPSFQTIRNSKLIIFNDAPNIAPALQKQIIKSVRDGADLLIFTGFTCIGRGYYKDSPLAEILPVIPGGLWDFKQVKEKSVLLDLKKGLVPSGAKMYYYWDVKVKEDAEILATAAKGQYPILLRSKIGKGSVTVLTATAFGDDTPDSFWRTEFSRNLIDTLPGRVKR